MHTAICEESWCRNVLRPAFIRLVAQVSGPCTSVADVTMTPYEQKQWERLLSHWTKKAQRRRILPPKAREALGAAGSSTRAVALRVADATPDQVKDALGSAAGATLTPVADKVVDLLDFVNDWAAEVTNPALVLKHHQKQGRDVVSLADLRALDLEHLDEVTEKFALQCRTLGFGEGAALGALAMIPVAGGAAAIGLDIVVMEVLSTAIATHVCHAYGLDATTPEMRPVVARMVRRSFVKQAPRAGMQRAANLAATTAQGRTNWSSALRKNHRLLAAVEKVMKRWNGVQHIPVQSAAKGLPVIAIVMGAGTNMVVLGDIAKQSVYYAQTLHLAQKYDLALPANLASLVADRPNDEANPDESST